MQTDPQLFRKMYYFFFGGGLRHGGAKLGWDIQIYWEGNPGIAAREWILGHLENMNLKKNKIRGGKTGGKCQFWGG